MLVYVLQLASLYWDATLRQRYQAHCQRHGVVWDGVGIMGPSFALGARQLCMPMKDLGCIGEGAYGKVS